MKLNCTQKALLDRYFSEFTCTDIHDIPARDLYILTLCVAESALERNLQEKHYWDDTVQQYLELLIEFEVECCKDPFNPYLDDIQEEIRRA